MKKYWKLLLGLLLMLVYVLIYMNFYLPAQADYETMRNQLSSSVNDLQTKVTENHRYTKVQNQIPDAISEMAEKRLALYSKFPAEMREEDQIMYILYLEEIFGTEIRFSFSTPQDLIRLSDGSVLQSLMLTVNYECSYKEFQEMISYLATDDKVTSVYDAKMNYDAEKDIAKGTITILRYLMNSELIEYSKPYITSPETGKENIFAENED